MMAAWSRIFELSDYRSTRDGFTSLLIELFKALLTIQDR